LDIELVKDHSVSLSSLTADTTYHFRISSTDAVGNLSTSTDETFATISAPVVVPPTVSQSTSHGGSRIMMLPLVLQPTVSTITPLAPPTPTSPTASTHPAFITNRSVGSTGSDIKQLQIFLNTHSYTVSITGAGSPNHETTFFGSATKAALIKFQKDNNILPATGDFGPRTRALINSTDNENTSSISTSANSSFTRNLEEGMTGDDVKQLQIYLNTHGYIVADTGAGSPNHETNLFGSATKSALIKFQKDNNITPAIGYFGEVTRGYVTTN
jgi:peptidoglycan hydrolase-like protein with peptidoglycan-binding domain